jgi:hypothetical protein
VIFIDAHTAANLELVCEGDVLSVIDICYSASAAVKNSRETLGSSAIEMVFDARAVL